MSSSGVSVFDSSIQKVNQLFHAIEMELGWTGRHDQTYSAVRAVLHALRDRLPAQEALYFSAQLPLVLKGTFFENWDMASVPVKMDREEFIQYVAKNAPYDVEGGPQRIITVVLTMILSSIDPGETVKIANELPKDIADLLGY